MSWILLLLACGTPPTDSGTPPMDTGDPDTDTCATTDLAGAPIGCAALQPQWCDNDHAHLDGWEACCQCNEQYCVRPNCDDPPPPGFPTDSGPELVFETGLSGGLLPIPQSVWVGPDPDGLLRMTGGDLYGIQPLSCTRTLNTLECEDHVVSGTPFSLFELRLTDADGDGAADGGIVRATARIEGDAVSTYAVFESDSTGLNASLGPNGLVPTDPIELMLGEPADPDSIPAMLEGVGAWDLLLANDDVALGARVWGVADWDQQVTVDGLTDLAGNPMWVAPNTMVSDPGLANDNLDFELDGVGWASADAALHTDQSGAASSGQFFAEVWQSGSIVGELEVPVDTPVLSFDWRRLLPDDTSPATLAFVVVTPTGRHALWTEDSSNPAGLTGQWNPVSVDLSDWAGQTVFVRFEVDSWFEPPSSGWQNYVWVPQSPPPGTGIAFDNMRLSDQ